ncbi:MAG: sugar ABC transporter ATP-binding protein [Peptoniphilaceae bacterium]|nr:sugar ABC transporter ATP-binding protein [Peptoniphilaceae bacterium]
MEDALLEMRDITKEFPGVKALEDVNFALHAGEIHALLGENGAGKSTLIKVLGGIYHPEHGEILIDGEPVTIDSVPQAMAHGIAIIHQEIVLVPYMSIAENIFLGREIMSGGFVDRAAMNREVAALLEDYGLNMDPRQLVADLSIAQKQMVEIIKAISQNSRILVMDEPTSSISDKEVDFLFGMMRQLAQKGVGIIYISHKMAELEQICDRVTVMRDGQVIATKVVKDSSREELINLMVGRQLTTYYSRSSHELGDVVLDVRHYDNSSLSDDVSFTVRKGEIVGFAGLIGAGRSEIMETIFGLRPHTRGTLFINGEEVKIDNSLQAMAHGMALVPEERHKDGLYQEQSVQFNLTIEVLDAFIKGVGVNRKEEREIARRYVDIMRTKTPSLEQSVGKLSGGNQQKVLIGRWLATKPQILILDEPTRGIDVGAKAEIYRIMNELAQEGMAIILISSELPEIVNMSDRTYVMKDGAIVGSLEGEAQTQENIMNMAAR